jgi:hypothetical protein
MFPIGVDESMGDQPVKLFAVIYLKSAEAQKGQQRLLIERDDGNSANNQN